MLVRDVMNTAVVAVPRSASIRQAARLLYDHHLIAAPVVDDAGRVAGIVSEMDLLRDEFETDPRAFAHAAESDDEPARTVAEVMTTGVRTVRAAADVVELADLMMASGATSVPVLQGDRLVGVVSRRDLLRVLTHSDARIRDDVLSTIRAYYPTGPSWAATVRDGVVRLQGKADEHAARVIEVIARTVPGVARIVLLDTPSGP
ncbi:MAG: CBS domain-containing protein [Actinomadura sp.]